jgi:hypothetical protein
MEPAGMSESPIVFDTKYRISGTKIQGLVVGRNTHEVHTPWDRATWEGKALFAGIFSIFLSRDVQRPNTFDRQQSDIGELHIVASPIYWPFNLRVVRKRTATIRVFILLCLLPTFTVSFPED